MYGRGSRSSRAAGPVQTCRLSADPLTEANQRNYKTLTDISGSARLWVETRREDWTGVTVSTDRYPVTLANGDPPPAVTLTNFTHRNCVFKGTKWRRRSAANFGEEAQVNLMNRFYRSASAAVKSGVTPFSVTQQPVRGLWLLVHTC